VIADLDVIDDSSSSNFLPFGMFRTLWFLVVCGDMRGGFPDLETLNLDSHRALCTPLLQIVADAEINLPFPMT